jgi:hypothetical protein
MAINIRMEEMGAIMALKTVSVMMAHGFLWLLIEQENYNVLQGCI